MNFLALLCITSKQNSSPEAGVLFSRACVFGPKSLPDFHATTNSVAADRADRFILRNAEPIPTYGR
jgi:hypothetical protein